MADNPDLDLVTPLTLQPDGRAPAVEREAADKDDYENYFRIRRSHQPRAWAGAARHVSREVLDDLPLTTLGAGTQRDLLIGISGLLLAASHWPEEGVTTGSMTRRGSRPAEEIRVPVVRWKLGHHLFHLVLSVMNSRCEEALTNLAAAQWSEAASNIAGVRLLLDSCTATMHYTSDFPPDSYEGLIRPTMEPPWMPSGFSGVFNHEHILFERNLKRLREAAKSPNTPARCLAASRLLWKSQSRNRREHRAICEKFVPGGDSLLQQHFNKVDQTNGETNDH